MLFEDFLIPYPKLTTEKWQLGNGVQNTLSKGALVLVSVPDYRWENMEVEHHNFDGFRECFYRLSKNDWQIPLVDLGTLKLGKTKEDTAVLLEELVKEIIAHQSFPLIIGGSHWLSVSVLKSLQSFNPFLDVCVLDSELSLNNNGTKTAMKALIDEFQYKHFTVMGYQIHQSQKEAIDLLKTLHFDSFRLSDLMKDLQEVEPFFRHSDYIGINLNAIESHSISLQPQINGLNSREICNYMKELGLNKALKCLGIFNWNPFTRFHTDFQLLAQMLWYFIDGVNIRKSHPELYNFESYFVLIDSEKHIFLKDIFSNKWYYGSEDVNQCIACSYPDYQKAQNGYLNPRLLKPRLL